MEIYYYKAAEANLGDDLNAWIWQRLIPNRLKTNDPVLMYGIGTIIGQSSPSAKLKIIFTSGAGYNPDLPDVADPQWRFVAVRGPLTAALLGLPPEASVTDGAILVSLFPEFHAPSNVRHGVVFVPHISSARAADWRAICEASGVEYLDPRDDHFSLIKRIGAAKLVLADAMHAAIIADSLRVPWIPLATSAEISSFKWMDWTLSLEVAYQPTQLSSMSLLQFAQQAVIRLTCQYHRSCEHTFKDALDAQRSFLRKKRKYESWLLGRIRWLLLGSYNRLLKFSSLRKPRFNIEKNIRLLRELSRHEGFLSDTTTFNSRLTEVRRRLTQI